LFELESEALEKAKSDVRRCLFKYQPKVE